jgi:predicted TIM-barrel enzyme
MVTRFFMRFLLFQRTSECIIAFYNRNSLSAAQIVDHACKEVETYLRVAGHDGIQGFIVENMADLPYVKVNQFHLAVLTKKFYETSFTF